ncbi:MAG: hypothetical protein R2941_06390 [Desulfobacterales bacterium]
MDSVYRDLSGTATCLFGLYLKGINHIRSHHCQHPQPLWDPSPAGIISYIFLNEVMEILPDLPGGLLVIASIILLQIKQGGKPASPAYFRRGRTAMKTESALSKRIKRHVTGIREFFASQHRDWKKLCFGELISLPGSTLSRYCRQVYREV